MRSRAVRVFGWVATALAVAAYAVLAHYVTARATEAGALAVGFAAAPYVAGAVILAWRSSRRIAMFCICAAAAAVLWSYSDVLAQNFGWVYFLQHVGFNLMLAAVFARTLAAGREPLCSRFAAMAHGRLDEDLARYTRQVTLAWTLFFVATAALSVILFAAAPIEVWSLFANVLSLPLVGLMFVVEYVVRLRALPNVRHVGLIETMRMYRRHTTEVSAPPSP